MSADAVHNPSTPDGFSVKTFCLKTSKIVFRTNINAVICGLILALSLANNVSANSNRTVAIVLSVNGLTSPVLEPFSSIKDGSDIKLSQNTELTFRLLGKCQTVSARGGQIAFTGFNFRLLGGKLIKRSQKACLRRVSLDRSLGIGGIKVRGKSKVIKIGLRPVFVLSTMKSPNDVEITILKNRKVIARGDFRGGHWALKTTLQEGKFYDINFNSSSSGRHHNIQAQAEIQSPNDSIRLVENSL